MLSYRPIFFYTSRESYRKHVETFPYVEYLFGNDPRTPTKSKIVLYPPQHQDSFGIFHKQQLQLQPAERNWNQDLYISNTKLIKSSDKTSNKSSSPNAQTHKDTASTALVTFDLDELPIFEKSALTNTNRNTPRELSIISLSKPSEIEYSQYPKGNISLPSTSNLYRQATVDRSLPFDLNRYRGANILATLGSNDQMGANLMKHYDAATSAERAKQPQHAINDQPNVASDIMAQKLPQDPEEIFLETIETVPTNIYSTNMNDWTDTDLYRLFLQVELPFFAQISDKWSAERINRTGLFTIDPIFYVLVMSTIKDDFFGNISTTAFTQACSIKRTDADGNDYEAESKMASFALQLIAPHIKANTYHDLELTNTVLFPADVQLIETNLRTMSNKFAAVLYKLIDHSTFRPFGTQKSKGLCVSDLYTDLDTKKKQSTGSFIIKLNFATRSYAAYEIYMGLFNVDVRRNPIKLNSSKSLSSKKFFLNDVGTWKKEGVHFLQNDRLATLFAVELTDNWLGIDY